MEQHAIKGSTPEGVLAELRACDRAERAAGAQRLGLACAWADLHPIVRDLPYGAPAADLETGWAVAAEAVAEFAAVHGVATEAGRTLIADAVELRDRLPKCWDHVQALRLPAWRARRIAHHTRDLSDEAAAWVDTQAAKAGGRIGWRTIQKVILFAIARFHPDRLPADPDAERWVRITPDTEQPDGAGWIDGRLDTPDLLDLEAALQAIAADLAAQGSSHDLGARRAHALGELARAALGQPTLPRPEEDADSPTDDEPERSAPAPAPAPAPATGRRATGAVRLYLHLGLADLADGSTGLAEVGTTGQWVTVEQVRRWCGTSGRIIVRPVIDLTATRSVPGYLPTDAIREHIALRDRTCVFPHCTRPARPVKRSRRAGRPDFSHDADHITPYAAGGDTSTDNLACLCRAHHRLKTHTGWTYWQICPGEYLWRSPGGNLFLRTAAGTIELPVTDRQRGSPAA